LKRCKKPYLWELHPGAKEYAAVIPTKYKDSHDWADFGDGFIRVFKLTNITYIVPVSAIFGLAHLLQENATSD